MKDKSKAKKIVDTKYYDKESIRRINPESNNIKVWNAEREYIHNNGYIKWCNEEVMKLWNAKNCKYINRQGVKINPFDGGLIRIFTTTSFKNSVVYNTMDMILVAFKLVDNKTGLNVNYSTLFTELSSGIYQPMIDRLGSFNIASKHVIFTYYCSLPSFISCDGEYRPQFSSYRDLITTIEKRSPSIYYDIEEYVYRIFSRRQWRLLSTIFSPKINETEKIKYVEDAIRDNRTIFKLLSVTWFNMIYSEIMNMTEVHTNETFRKIFLNPEYIKDDIDFMKDLFKKYGNEIHMFKSSLINCGLKSAMGINPFTQCGYKFIPLNVKEVQDPLKIRYKPWREWLISNKCNDLVINNIAPGFSIILDWFYIKNSRRGLFDNKSQYERMKNSEIAEDIIHILHEAQRGTYIVPDEIDNAMEVMKDYQDKRNTQEKYANGNIFIRGGRLPNEMDTTALSTHVTTASSTNNIIGGKKSRKEITKSISKINNRKKNDSDNSENDSNSGYESDDESDDDESNDENDNENDNDESNDDESDNNDRNNLVKNLPDQEKINIFNNQAKKFLNTKFKKLYEKVDETIDYTIEELRMSEVTLGFASEFVGRTFADSIDMVAKSPVYDKAIGMPFTKKGYHFFVKYIFDVCYGLLCINTKLGVIHGDLHLNNATIGKLYYVSSNNLYTPSVAENKIVYMIDDTSYVFLNNSYFGCLIDFSRAIISPNHLHLFKDISIPEIYPLVDNEDKFRVTETTNLLNAYLRMFPQKIKYKEELTVLFKNNYAEVFKIMTCIDIYLFSIRFIRLIDTIKYPIYSKCIDLVSQIYKLAEQYITSEMNNLINNNSYVEKIKLMEFPMLTIIKKVFVEYIDGAIFNKDKDFSKLPISDFYNYNNEFKYSLSKRSMFPEISKTIKYYDNKENAKEKYVHSGNIIPLKTPVSSNKSDDPHEFYASMDNENYVDTDELKGKPVTLKEAYAPNPREYTDKMKDSGNIPKEYDSLIDISHIRTVRDYYRDDHEKTKIKNLEMMNYIATRHQVKYMYGGSNDNNSIDNIDIGDLTSGGGLIIRANLWENQLLD